jgi:hypothetical protein
MYRDCVLLCGFCAFLWLLAQLLSEASPDILAGWAAQFLQSKSQSARSALAGGTVAFDRKQEWL